MASGGFRFDRFLLDPLDRSLRLDGAPVELNARYFDALLLLVREQGKLVTKDRFLEEVWRGVPVTDEALTQCVRTLRRRLGDDVASPRFIETVPKHGYRFIAPVEPVGAAASDAGAAAPSASASTHPWRPALLVGGAGALGGGAAGLLGGLIYGLIGASQPPQPEVSAVSVLLVLVCVCGLVGLTGGAGVGLGMAAGGFTPGRPGRWSVLGGALGGMIVGGVVKLLGLDAFTLLLGRSPGEITGAPEGALLGGAVALGAWLASRGAAAVPLRRAAVAAGLAGGVAGAAISLLGGRLMGGSLALLADRFPGSRLRLDQIGALLGEDGFGPLSRAVTGALEGALFGGCVVAAMILARRRLGERR